MKKFFIYSFVIIITLLLTIVGLLYADIWDIEPPDVSDLEIKYVEVPPEDNAFTYLKQAAEIYYEPEPEDDVSEDEFYDHFYEVVEGRKSDPELFDDYITKNQKTFKLINQALNCSNYQSKKLLPSGSTIDFESFVVSPAIDARHFLEHYFFYNLNKKRYNEAFESAFHIFHLGKLQFAMENPCHIDLLCSITLQEVALTRIIENISLVSSKQLVDFSNQLKKNGTS